VRRSTRSPDPLTTPSSGADREAAPQEDENRSAGAPGVGTRLRRLLGNADFWTDWTALIALIVLSVIFTLRSSVFLSGQNIRGMLADSSLVIVLALGMTFVIAIGGIDLSIATTVTLASVMMGVAYSAGWPILMVVLVGLATGTLVGSFNGFLVARVKIPDFIVTLGSFSLTSGIALVVSQGIPVQISDQLLRTLSTGSIWLFRLNFLLAVALAIALHVLLFHMRFGTYVLATGGNLAAARAMGISVARTKFLVYVLCGSLAGLTAVMLIAFIGAAQPAPSTQFLLSAIASVVLGGVSLFGGRATIHGPVVGAIFLTVLYDGLTLLGFSAFYQPIVVGIVVIAAAVLMRRVR
jgi:ribose/xylose/arabinose/galactoside ABC-type transport system permease subunit